MEKKDFYYYLHKTKINPSMLEDIFNNGLTSRYGASIHSTIARIDEKDLEKYGLDQMIKGYLGDTDLYDAVFLFKIPKDI